MSSPPPPRRRVWTVVVSVAVLVTAAVGVGWALADDGKGHHAGRGTGGSNGGLVGAWSLVAYPNGAAVPADTADTALSVSAGGMLVAGDGCNTLSGHIDIGVDTFTVGELATTLQACAFRDPSGHDPAVAGVLQLEGTVPRLLSGTVHWSVSGDRLVLTHGSDRLTYRRFDKAGYTDPNLLPGTTWRLNTIEDPASSGSASSSSDYLGVTIRFTGGPGFVVTYLCVTESGQAVAENGTLTLKVLASHDAKPCSSSMNDIDQQVRKRLTGPLTWSIVAGQLVIVRLGVGSLGFDGVPQATSTGGPTS